MFKTLRYFICLTSKVISGLNHANTCLEFPPLRQRAVMHLAFALLFERS